VIRGPKYFRFCCSNAALRLSAAKQIILFGEAEIVVKE
jgi:hypothetical protein